MHRSDRIGKFTKYGTTTQNYIMRLNTDGTLDTSFATTGTGFDSFTPNGITSIALDGQGKVYVGGTFNTYNGTVTQGIARLNSNGSLDTTFVTGTGFAVDTNGNQIVSGLYYDSSASKLYAVGQFVVYNGTGVNGLARLSTNGKLDDYMVGTGVGSVSGAIVFAIAADQNTGKVYVGAGGFTYYNGIEVHGLARLNFSGTVDDSFKTGQGFDGGLETLFLDGNGKVLAGGEFTTYNRNPAGHIARLNSDGSFDTTFAVGTGFSGGNVYAIATDPVSGKIYAGGDFTSYQGTTANGLVRLNTNGTLDVAYLDFNGAIKALATDSSGNVYVGGVFTTYNGATVNYLVRFPSSGTAVDPAFTTGTGFDGEVDGLALNANGLHLVGSFTAYNGTSGVNGITRLNTDGSLDTAYVANVGPGTSAALRSVVLDAAGNLYTTGHPSGYQGLPIHNYDIIKLKPDGSLDTNFDMGGCSENAPNNYAVSVDNMGSVYIGGDLNGCGGVMTDQLGRFSTATGAAD